MIAVVLLTAAQRCFCMYKSRRRHSFCMCKSRRRHSFCMCKSRRRHSCSGILPWKSLAGFWRCDGSLRLGAQAKKKGWGVYDQVRPQCFLCGGVPGASCMCALNIMVWAIETTSRCVPSVCCGWVPGATLHGCILTHAAWALCVAPCRVDPPCFRVSWAGILRAESWTRVSVRMPAVHGARR